MKSEKNPDIQAILRELLNEPEDIRAYKIHRTLSRIDYIKEMCGDVNYTPARYRDALINRNNVLDRKIYELEAAKIENPAKAEEEIKTK